MAKNKTTRQGLVLDAFCYKPQAGEPEKLRADMRRHIVSNLGNDPSSPGRHEQYMGLSYAVRDRLIDQWIKTQRSLYDHDAKRVYYLSLEFLPGPFLKNNISNLGLEDDCAGSLDEDWAGIDDLAELEPEPGLGNGGLGRLASCFLDSMATLRIPGYGYGIRYSYGIFRQAIEDGAQKEQADNWLSHGSPWGFERPKYTYSVHFYGQIRPYTDVDGCQRYHWIDTQRMKAMAFDLMVPGYRSGFTTNMRLWAARAARGFDLQFFNSGDYVGALEDKIRSENISMVLYPDDTGEAGKELRLKQQYFFVSATIQDIVRRFRKKNLPWRELPEHVAIQLNETHPAVAIPELMRLLLDGEHMDWEEAWRICVRTFAYTNHTVLPEALETWPVELFERLLPRHMMLIYEINRRFLEEVALRFPGDPERQRRLSLIQEEHGRTIRMAHLAIVGSHRVNGVARLHSDIIKRTIFRDFHELYPERFTNITNGVTPRRFLAQCNPGLAALITRKIGDGWVANLAGLRELEPYAEDAGFREEWMSIRLENKRKLSEYIKKHTGSEVDPESIFDVQAKRIHEYKRQLLNVLHAISLANRLRRAPDAAIPSRTVIFSGKAAPGYHMAKSIIRLINGVAEDIENDPLVRDRLRVVFLANYSVRLAEKIIPATDLSEQISTAGMEASGTGNMKFGLNGALTIGTYDGANIEMLEEVGAENFFLFGLREEEVSARRRGGQSPGPAAPAHSELAGALNRIRDGHFGAPGEFDHIVRALEYEDYFMVLADFEDYLRAQEEVNALYGDPHEWSRRSILNTSRMGRFSSDRAIGEYAEKIWNVSPLP
ncbi:glycogen/starch/alpha-glucan phosphorylase [Desulfohalovibrio reitneri]|uniref:glycogen/starch/alpha-glucan phosphorylase n=1 Tax=Desulfohalovibrio reitneri TaxID=1307759 RepID=UPI0009E0B2D5|nr:glycogen/starch/alpha-glucan phosphorylase [Desulfohalovibrio reitneri]